MNFNSIGFLFFLLLIVIVYWWIPSRLGRNIWLLGASYFFYAQWNAKYSLLMLFSTILTYVSAILIELSREKGTSKKTKSIFIIGLISNLSLLFTFKYFDFVVESVNELLENIGAEKMNLLLGLVLPVGISFYIIQSTGYLIDVFREEVKAEKNFVDYALFISFFPQLVAGPIERSSNLLCQIREKRKWDIVGINQGIELLLFGLFKKIAIADVCAMYVDEVFEHLTEYAGVTMVLATILFTIQIYCDFSGYTDIARGAAYILGYRLAENFKSPYFSQSVGEYWRRWHITLGNWLKDYLYIPLGGSRRGNVRTYINLFLVFAVSGLWHGASWNYVIWGMLHGILVVSEHLCMDLCHCNKSNYLLRIFRILKTQMLIGACFVVFRAKSLQDVMYVFKSVIHNFELSRVIVDWLQIESKLFFTSSTFRIFFWGSLLINILGLSFIDIVKMMSKEEQIAIKSKSCIGVKVFIYLFMGMSCMIWYWFQNGTFCQPTQFIYFQF